MQVIQIVFEVNCSDRFSIEIHGFRIRKRIRCPHNTRQWKLGEDIPCRNISPRITTQYTAVCSIENCGSIPCTYPYRLQDLGPFLWIVKGNGSIRPHAEEVRRSLEVAHFPVAKIMQVIEYKS